LFRPLLAQVLGKLAGGDVVGIVVLVAGANAKHTTLLGYSLTKGSYHKIFVVGTVVTGIV
jgi:hypothetical protein